jgi:hypothetical protein
MASLFTEPRDTVGQRKYCSAYCEDSVEVATGRPLVYGSLTLLDEVSVVPECNGRRISQVIAGPFHELEPGDALRAHPNALLVQPPGRGSSHQAKLRTVLASHERALLSGRYHCSDSLEARTR